ncbi:uncharacterized protein [Dermacentor albipictus]
MSTRISRLPIVPPATPAPTMPSTSSTTTRTPTSTTTTTKTTMTTATTTPTTTTTTRTTMTMATMTPTTTTTTRTTTTTIKMTTTTTTSATTTTTTMTTTRPRTTTSYPADKGPLLCTIKALNRYPGHRMQEVIMEGVPNATVCDYIILDIAQSPDGSYNTTSYDLLPPTNRYLFTIDNSGVHEYVESIISSRKFIESVRLIYKVLPIKGCGLFEELSSAGSTYTPAEVTSLKSIYKTLHENLKIEVGIKTPFTFYAFRPYKLAPNFATYTQFMQSISGMASVIIILTITEAGNSQPEPPGAWDSSCLFFDSQTRIEDAVRLISMVTPPMNMFALAISFRIDIFPKVQLSEIRQKTTTPGLERVGGSSNHIIQEFKSVCYANVYKSDMKGANFKYFPDGCCTFAKFSDPFHSGVASFETAQSIQDKINKTNEKLQQLNLVSTHVVGWLAHNLTFNLAPQECGGQANRLLKMREAIG